MSKVLTILSVVLLATAAGAANQAAADSLHNAGAAGTPVVALNAVGPIKIGETANNSDEVLDQARNIMKNKKPAKPIKHHVEQRVVERSKEAADDEHKLQIMGIDSASALPM